MSFQHQTLAAGQWQKLTLMEQMGNIGSEISRASRWQGKDDKLFQGAVIRTFELFNLTLQDARWKKRLKEITRAREVFCDAVFGGKEYYSTFEELERYFFAFAMAARRNR